MPTEAALKYAQDLRLVQHALAGRQKAACDLRSRYHSKLTAMLCARGASATEAEDLLTDLWSDCFGAANPHQRLLLKYQGRCALESWLITVATNRLIDLKRHQAFRGELPYRQSTNTQLDPFDLIPGASTHAPEAPLLNLLRRGVASALANCDQEALIMLKLVHIHRITQREIGRIWGWHESKVSRILDCAREKIKSSVLSEVKRIDPWIRLTWDDFSDLCRCSPGLLSLSEAMDDLQDSTLHQSKRKDSRNG